MQHIQIEIYFIFLKIFYKEIEAYMVIVRFIMLWKLSTTYLKDLNNLKNLKYYIFIMFKTIFFITYQALKWRWKNRNIKFPIDLYLIRNWLFKITIKLV